MNEDNIMPEEQAELDQWLKDIPPMSHWNYRVVRKYNDVTESFDYTIREVYYDSNKQPCAWTSDCRDLYEEDLDSLKIQLVLMLECCDRPVLTLVEKDGKEELI